MATGNEGKGAMAAIGGDGDVHFRFLTRRVARREKTVAVGTVRCASTGKERERRT